MTNHREDTVRLGPIGLFALVAAICVAVMSVLALSTARASLALASRQSSFIRDGYGNEANAQAFLAEVCETVAEVRLSGGNGLSASAAVAQQTDDLLSAACEDASRATAGVDGNEVSARFVSESGRCLDILIIIGDDATVTVASWKATTLWDEDTGDVLWTGSASVTDS